MNKQIQAQTQVQIDQQSKNITTSHSLSADIVTGWKPNLKIIGPVPLNFDNPYIDSSIKQILKSQASFYYVCYLGPRPLNTFKMHEILIKNYRYKYTHLYSVDYGHLKNFFHKFYNEFQPLMKRPFYGMNPNRKTHSLIFDSNFQSGNLDCAVKVNQNQYDLVIRIDSNTAGHIMWYYFRINNPQQKQKTVRFNIVNLRKNKSCYERGMRPYMRKSLNNEKWTQWAQNGDNLQVTQERIRFGKQSIIVQNNMISLQQQIRHFRCLSFDITFKPKQSYEVAYCVPYTYSDLMNDIKFVKKKCQQNDKIHFQIDNSNQSLSGLQIPILKITDFKKDPNSNKNQYKEQSQKKKFSVFIIGRQHSGQSNSSHVMKGILQKLIADCPESQYLRKKCVFKIIPMLNVDGVVIGNFRTSLYGKDLNRLFKKNQLFLMPQIEMCKNQFLNLQRIHKKKMLLFLDIHGHSVRRNSFCYGPGILDANAFSDVRELAKIISTKTQIFRYPSCTFRINDDKKTTARACFSKFVGLAYTIQSSNWSYYSKQTGKMTDFTSESWRVVGQGIIDGVVEYLYEKMKLKKERKRKRGDNQSQQEDFQFIKKVDSNSKNSKFLLQKNRKINLKQKFRLSINGNNKKRQEDNQQPILTQREKKSHFQLKNNQEQENFDIRYSDNRKVINRKHEISKIQEADVDLQNQSDKFSQNQMDSDSQADDLSKQQFDKYMNGAKKMMIQFEKAYYGDQYQKKGTLHKRLKSNSNLQKLSTRSIKKNSQVMACLRKKQLPEKVDIASKIQLNTRKIVDKRPVVENNSQFPVNSNLNEDFQKSLKFNYHQVNLPSYQISNRMKAKSNSQPINEKNSNQDQSTKRTSFRNSKQLQKLDHEYYEQKQKDWGQQGNQEQYQNYFKKNQDVQNNPDTKMLSSLKKFSLQKFQVYNKSKKLQKYPSIETRPQQNENKHKLQTIAQTIHQEPHFAIQNKSLRMMKSNHKHKKQMQKYLKDQYLQEKKQICIQQINFPLSVQMNNPRKSGKMIANVISHLKQVENQNVTSSILTVSPKKQVESAMKKRVFQNKNTFIVNSSKYLPQTTKINPNLNLQVNVKNQNQSPFQKNRANSNNQGSTNRPQAHSQNAISIQKVIKLKTIPSQEFNQKKPFRKSAKSSAKQKIEIMINQEKKINKMSNGNFNDINVNIKRQLSSQSSYLPKIKINIKKNDKNNLNTLHNSSSSISYGNTHTNLIGPLSSYSLQPNSTNFSKDFLVIQSQRKRYRQVKQLEQIKQSKQIKQQSQKFEKYQKIERFSIQSNQNRSSNDYQKIKGFQIYNQTDYKDENMELSDTHQSNKK